MFSVLEDRVQLVYVFRFGMKYVQCTFSKKQPLPSETNNCVWHLLKSIKKQNKTHRSLLTPFSDIFLNGFLKSNGNSIDLKFSSGSSI